MKELYHIISRKRRDLLGIFTEQLIEQKLLTMESIRQNFLSKIFGHLLFQVVSG
jgi:hypothetical protein